MSGDALTPREMDILRLLGRGLGNKEIADELGVSVTTVRTHLNKVYEKVGPMSRVELALYAAQAAKAVMGEAKHPLAKARLLSQLRALPRSPV